MTEHSIKLPEDRTEQYADYCECGALAGRAVDTMTVTFGLPKVVAELPDDEMALVMAVQDSLYRLSVLMAARIKAEFEVEAPAP